MSLRTEPAPTSGTVDPPFRWEDVLRDGPPGDAERGPPVWCVTGAEIVSGGVRVENPLLVRLHEDGTLELEDRLAVTTRAMAPVIETERSLIGQKLEDAKANAHQRADDASNPAEVAAHRATARLAGFARTLTRGVATVPDKLSNAARRAYAFLSTADGRRRFRHGLVDPHDLDGEQKAVTLFVGVAAILGTLMLTHFVVTLAVPDLARAWRSVFFLFLYGFVGSIGLPLPIEPILFAASLAIGPVFAILVTLLAKVLAAWMVFFLGDEVNEKLRAKAETRPWLRTALDKCERFAQRLGILGVAVFIATPGLPDAVALYVFGSMKMRLWKFLLGVVIGGAVLYTALTFGLLSFLGR